MRRGNDWTNRFKQVAADAYLISVSSAIIERDQKDVRHAADIWC